VKEDVRSIAQVEFQKLKTNRTKTLPGTFYYVNTIVHKNSENVPVDETVRTNTKMCKHRSFVNIYPLPELGLLISLRESSGKNVNFIS
jgi:hypothetical protein